MIVTTLIYKIPPTLPFPKGGITPLWPPAQEGLWPGGQRGEGRFSNGYVDSILRPLINLISYLKDYDGEYLLRLIRSPRPIYSFLLAG